MSWKNTTAVITLLVLTPGRAPAEQTLEGLWHGEIVYSAAQTELEIIVEIGTDPQGNLGGTIDVPSQHMKFHQLSDASIDGADVEIGFIRDTEKRQGAHFVFDGEMSADGQVIAGIFTGWYTDENNNKAPFQIRRLGDPGSERPADRRGPLHELSDDCEEARQAFNETDDHVRLVLLLSPT